MEAVNFDFNSLGKASWTSLEAEKILHNISCRRNRESLINNLESHYIEKHGCGKFMNKRKRKQKSPASLFTYINVQNKFQQKLNKKNQYLLNQNNSV